MHRSSSVRRGGVSLAILCLVARAASGQDGATPTAACNQAGCFEGDASGVVSAKLTGRASYRLSPAGELLIVLATCASVRTAELNEMLVQRSRDSTLLSGDSSNVNEFLAELYGADLIVNMEFGSTGTTNNSPGRYMNTTMLDMQHSRATVRHRSDRDGWQWSSDDFVEETLAPFRALAYDVCPWLGTIEYVRTSETITATSDPPSVYEGSTSVYSTKVEAFEDEQWTFKLTRRHLSPVRIETGGGAKMRSTGLQQTTSSNKNCFWQDAAGELRDGDLRTHASDVLEDRQSSSGAAGGPLLSPKVRLARLEETVLNGVTVKVPTWMLSVEAAYSGTSQSTSVSERKGGCGTWSKTNPEGTGRSGYGRLITFTADQLSERKNELDGKVVIADTESGAGGHEKETVTFKLTRK